MKISFLAHALFTFPKIPCFFSSGLGNPLSCFPNTPVSLLRLLKAHYPKGQKGEDGAWIRHKKPLILNPYSRCYSWIKITNPKKEENSCPSLCRLFSMLVLTHEMIEQKFFLFQNHLNSKRHRFFFAPVTKVKIFLVSENKKRKGKTKKAKDRSPISSFWAVGEPKKVRSLIFR